MPKPTQQTILKALHDLIEAVRAREVRGTLSRSGLLEVTERAYIVLEREKAEEEEAKPERTTT